MANSNGWGDGAANNAIGWGQGANNAIAWGDSHAKSWAGATDIVGLTTDPAASAFIAATGITGATQQAAIDNLVKGLKADGIWSKMKAVYPFVTDNRNLASYTEDFSNGFWTKYRSNISVNAINSPIGTLTADKLIENSQGDEHSAYFLTTATAGAYNFSVYAKAGERNWIALAIEMNGSTLNTYFDLTNGVVGTNPSGGTATITSAGNGWYRCSLSRVYVSGNFTAQFKLASANGTAAYTGNGTSGAYFWGAQLELGSTATTYQPIATTQQAYIASQFKYNLVNPVDSDAAYRLVFNGGLTHSSTGFTPNGINGYADTKLVPNGTLNQNSTHISGYSRTNAFSGAIFGCFDSVVTNGLYTNPKFGGGTQESRNNSGFGSNATSTDSTGFWINNRISSSQYKIFRNNTTNQTSNTNSTGLCSLSAYMGALNRFGLPVESQIREIAFGSIGDGLTDTEAANLYTRVQAYQTALSRQV
jgi:hypothetical protein